MKPKNINLNERILKMSGNFAFPEHLIPAEMKKHYDYKNCYNYIGVPCIGWFWRYVDFESVGGKLLGVEDDFYAKRFGVKFELVGFDESGKFLVDQIFINRQQWANLKARVFDFCDNQNQKSFESMVILMQSFLKTGIRVDKYDFKKIGQYRRRIEKTDEKIIHQIKGRKKTIKIKKPATDY